MFDMLAADRWRPNAPLIGVLLSLSLFLVACTSTIATLHGPVLLNYQIAPTAHAHLWRVTAVWPASFAWDAGLRPGTLLHGNAPPATQGVTTVKAWTGHSWRRVDLPPPGDTAPWLAWIELTLAAIILAIGAGTLLLARVRTPALFLLVFCLDVAVGLCGVAAFSHAGVLWGSVLFEICWFGFLPSITLLLATTLPPGGRTLALGWQTPAALSGAMLGLLALGLMHAAFYTPTREAEGILFVLTEACAIGVWGWRAAPMRSRPQWPEYRLVLVGIGGTFGGFALLAILPAILQWHLPWPPEVSGFVLVLFPASLSWALLRHQLLDLRRPLQRTAITLVLLSGALGVGLAVAASGAIALGMSIAVLVAGIGLPLAQRAIDRRFPDGQGTYAALLRQSGERLGLAVEVEDVRPILELLRQGLGLAGLSVRRDDLVLAQVGMVDPAYGCRFTVRHDTHDLATLDVGEKLHHDALLAADREALEMFCQQLGAFLARQRLTLQLRETVARLEETQQRLLTARRLERERLGQSLHRGPLQDVLLLGQKLPPDGDEAQAAVRLATSLRAILTDTASTALSHLGLPAALRAYVTHLAPYAREHQCALTLEVDEAVGTLADDESFALYQLAHEALANALRHSGARQIDVTLQVEGQNVVLEVCDNGCGLPGGWEQLRLEHRGLRDALDLVSTVRGAAATAGAGMSEGTVIHACVPLRRRLQRLGEEQAMHDDAIRVLIAEDHAVVRQGLRHLVMEDPQMRVVGEASTGYEVLSLVLQHRPHVVLLDLDLPGQNGLDALQAVRAHVPQPPRTLVLSAFRDEEYVRRARELGVSGFLSKGCDGAQLRDAIYQIMAGTEVLDAAIARIVKKQSYSHAGRFRRYTDGSFALSTAELAVLQHMMGDAPYEEIAEHLGRKYSTVRSQAAKICQKLGVNSRQQAVLKALQLGILDLDAAELLGESQHRGER